MGILSSSQPLVDAVTADANNPMGGNTLSMAQGGAVVDTSPAYMFANGGLGTYPRRTQGESMIVPYATSEQMRSAQLSADKQARLKREEELRQVPADTQFTQQARLNELAPRPDYVKLGGDPYASRTKVLAKNVIGGGINTVLGLADTAPIIGALYDMAFASPQLDPDGNPLPRPTKNMESAAAKFMGRVDVELQPLASEIIQKLYGNPTAQEFLQSARQSEIMGLIAETVDSRLSRSEAPDQAQASDTPEAIERARLERINSGAPDQADAPYTPDQPRRIANSYLNLSASGELDTRYGGDENTSELDTRNEFLTEVASVYNSEIADSAGALIASAKAPAALSQGDVISDEALASGVAALDEEADTRVGMAAVGDGGAAALLEAEAQATADAAVVDPAGETAGGDTSAAMPRSPGERPSATATTDTGGGAAAAVAQVFDKPMTKDDATKSIQDYKEKFLAEMPEYEGMSEEEKGFAFIEAGLRVMAGQSPNAITNIAKGLQGLGPELAKGAKEKREWNRQIELSAAKYSLQNMARDAAEERADAREGYFFYDQSKKSDKLPYGQMVFLSKGKLADLGGNIPANLADKDLLSKTAAATTAAAANLKKVLRGELDDYKISSVEADRYVKQLDKAKVSLTQSEAGISLLALTKARIAASPGEIGSFASGFNELLRKTAVGVDLPWAKRFTTGKYTLISQARSDVNVALQALIKSSLGSTQAANSISNKDVELLANAYVDSAFQSDKSWNFLGIDENALGGRLDKAIQVFRDNQENALSTFDRITTRIDQAEDTFKQSKTLGLNMLPGPFERDYFSAQIQQIQPYADKLRNISNTTGSVQVSVPVLGANIQSPTGTYTLDKSGKYIFTPKVN